MAPIGQLGLTQVDCHDPVALAGFWCQVLGVEVEAVYGDPPQYVNIGAQRPAPDPRGIAFQRVPEPKSVKNRLHFDIEVDDVESATERVVAIGGRRAPIEDVSEYGFHWRVMSDPEGNEFCLIYD